jgi:Family of unknown function (DUF6283)
VRGPAQRPCTYCPYKKSTPSGLWAESEYEKLRGYDLPTDKQPFAVFACHEAADRLCAGWCGTHDMDENMGLRIAALTSMTPEDLRAARDYVSPEPLWESGEAAYAHGVARIENPDAAAQAGSEKLRPKVAKRSLEDAVRVLPEVEEQVSPLMVARSDAGYLTEWGYPAQATRVVAGNAAGEVRRHWAVWVPGAAKIVDATGHRRISRTMPRRWLADPADYAEAVATATGTDWVEIDKWGTWPREEDGQ